MSKLKVFSGYEIKGVPGCKYRGRDVIVAATSQKAAHAALEPCGVGGWSLYSFRLFWTESSAKGTYVARNDPGVVYYKPESVPDAPYVRWDEPYPIEHIPAYMRSES
jgi:hypothetical protein